MPKVVYSTRSGALFQDATDARTCDTGQQATLKDCAATQASLILPAECAIWRRPFPRPAARPRVVPQSERPSAGARFAFASGPARVPAERPRPSIRFQLLFFDGPAGHATRLVFLCGFLLTTAKFTVKKKKGFFMYVCIRIALSFFTSSLREQEEEEAGSLSRYLD